MREGKSLHESLAETRLVPALALEMIEVGEASGALAAMLTSVAEFYEEEVSTRLQRTLTWVSPAILVVMAVVVGFILISLYLPMFSLQSGHRGIELDGDHHQQSDYPAGADDAAERDKARRLAERYRCPFVDLREQRIDPELFRSIPAELMFRYNFVPLESHDTTLVVAMADPSQLQLTDELSLLLGKRLQIKVATASQIGDLLKRTEQSQRVLDQATEGSRCRWSATRRTATKIFPWRSSRAKPA